MINVPLLPNRLMGWSNIGRSSSCDRSQLSAPVWSTQGRP